jgi:hypothetical protein
MKLIYRWISSLRAQLPRRVPHLQTLPRRHLLPSSLPRNYRWDLLPSYSCIHRRRSNWIIIIIMACREAGAERWISMGWMVEYPGGRDDGFGTFLDRTCSWKVSHSFSPTSCQALSVQSADDQTRSRHVFRISSMLGTPLPFCNCPLYSAIGQ